MVGNTGCPLHRRGSPRLTRAERLELAAALLLALAAVATAWSGYQSRAGTAGRPTRSPVREPGRVDPRSDVANRQIQIDVSTFAVGGRVRARGRVPLRLLPQALPAGVRDGRRRLGRDEAAEEPRCPLTPFAMPEYKLFSAEEAESSRRRPPRPPTSPGSTSSAPTTTRFASSLLGCALLRRLQHDSSREDPAITPAGLPVFVAPRLARDVPGSLV